MSHVYWGCLEKSNNYGEILENCCYFKNLKKTKNFKKLFSQKKEK